MVFRDQPSSIFSRKGKGFRQPRLIVVLFAFLGVTVNLASFPGPPGEFAGQPAGFALRSAPQIPVGYILPAQLDRTLSVEDAHVGDVVRLRIMQEVPLPNRDRIPFRSIVKGSVVRVTRDEDEIGVELTVRFDAVSHRKENLPVATSLRAMASSIAVREAQAPGGAYDEAFPRWATTRQIGGDIRYGDGSSVRNFWNETVGQAVLGGVLGHLKANPVSGCEGADSADDPQALWLFSANACGIYGLKGVELIHNGESEPVGEITFHFKKGNMKLRAGTGMLLQVVSRP
jgi:hypothetical protein